MLRAALVLFAVAALPQAVSAHVVRHSSIPEAYRGTWAPAGAACKDGDKAAVVLKEQAYETATQSCAVEAVSETPSPKGSTYSARLQCAAPGGSAQKTTTVNVIIRPNQGDRISLGLDFSSLKAYQRCPAAGSATK